jgi:hypothetical protein
LLALHRNQKSSEANDARMLGRIPTGRLTIVSPSLRSAIAEQRVSSSVATRGRPQRSRDGSARGRLHLGQSESGQRDGVWLAGSVDGGRTGSLLVASKMARRASYAETSYRLPAGVDCFTL